MQDKESLSTGERKMLFPFLFFFNDPIIYWSAENPFHNKSLIPKSHSQTFLENHM